MQPILLAMVAAQAKIEKVAELLARDLADGPRDRVRAVFALTLRGFDYDTVIDALHHGLRVGLFHEQGSRLVAARDRTQQV
jgi:hypothetical protein